MQGCWTLHVKGGHEGSVKEEEQALEGMGRREQNLAIAGCSRLQARPLTTSF